MVCSRNYSVTQGKRKTQLDITYIAGRLKLVCFYRSRSYVFHSYKRDVICLNCSKMLED
jgi:hypothetical protein